MTRAARAVLAAAVIVLLAACSDDEPSDATTTTTTTTESHGTVAPSDASLVPLLITKADLPPGYAQSDVDDTITSFCAGQDATSGLSASGRAITGFTRTPPGASVIEVVFRFEHDDAATFVEQARELLTSCSGVPVTAELAFDYEPLSDAVAAVLEGTEASASAHGTSVGSGTLTVQIAVVQHGDLGMFVAVLGRDEPREETDALARATFEAALARLAG